MLLWLTVQVLVEYEEIPLDSVLMREDLSLCLTEPVLVEYEEIPLAFEGKNE